MPTKIDIISGFLGAGKTTLIQKLLAESFSGQSTALIENEFGEIGIDGVLLKQTGMKVREINSGCICCTLAGSFDSALKEVLRKYRPDRIIIEPSGVGKLSGIVEACARFALREDAEIDAAVAVADALKYRMYSKNFGEFYNDQIRSAKAVVLSRTQSADPETLQAIVSDIRQQNATAAVVTTPWDQLTGNAILAAARQGASPLLKHGAAAKAEHHHCGHGGHKHECRCGHDADEVFEVWSVQTPKVFRLDELDRLAAQLESTAFGTVLRAKGIVPAENGGWHQFDYTPGEWKKNEISAEYTGRLCVIGEKLDRNKLASLFGV